MIYGTLEAGHFSLNFSWSIGVGGVLVCLKNYKSLGGQGLSRKSCSKGTINPKPLGRKAVCLNHERVPSSLNIVHWQVKAPRHFMPVRGLPRQRLYFRKVQFFKLRVQVQQ